MNDHPPKKRKAALKAFTVYLDKDIKEDADKIRFLEKHKKRPGYSETIRAALDTHMAFLAGKLSTQERSATARAEPTYHDIDDDLPETAIEASKTFLKPRR